MIEILGCLRPPHFLRDLLAGGAELDKLFPAVINCIDANQKAQGCIFLSKTFAAQDFSFEQFKRLLIEGPKYLAYNFLHPDPTNTQRPRDLISFDKLQFLLETPEIKLNAIYGKEQSSPEQRAVIIVRSQAQLEAPSLRYMAGMPKVAEEIPIYRPEALAASELTQALIGFQLGESVETVRQTVLAVRKGNVAA